MIEGFVMLGRVLGLMIIKAYRKMRATLSVIFTLIGYVVSPMPRAPQQGPSQQRPKPKDRPKAPTGQNGSREGRPKYRLVPAIKEGRYHLERWSELVEDYLYEKGNLLLEEADQIIKNLERETIYYREGGKR